MRGGADAPVIAVFSPKGGVGTSAIASNLAVALQQELGDVILMDGDLQFGDVLVHLNTRATRTMIDLIHDTGLEVDLVGEILLPHSSGLKLLLAPAKPELADAVSSPMITEIVTELRKQSKAVVIDTYSMLTDETLTILDIADYILVILVPELPAIKNTRSFLDLADELEFDPDRLRVVINKADELGGVPPNKVEQVLKLQHTFHIPRDPQIGSRIEKRGFCVLTRCFGPFGGGYYRYGPTNMAGFRPNRRCPCRRGCLNAMF